MYDFFAEKNCGKMRRRLGKENFVEEKHGKDELREISSAVRKHVN